MAIGQVDGVCKICGEKFTVKRKFHKRSEANYFEESMQGQFDTCPSCYREQKCKEQHAIKDSKPITITLWVSKITENNPITIHLTGGTYPIKEQLKELSYKWDPDNYAWAKAVTLEEVNEEILSLRKIKKVTVINRVYKSRLEEWKKAHTL